MNARMSVSICGAISVISYVLGAIAVMMVVVKLDFHIFSNDDIIAVVFFATLMRIASGFLSRDKGARDAASKD